VRFLPLFLFFLLAPNARGACPADDFVVVESRAVMLQTAIPESSYYYRSNNFVVFVERNRFDELVAEAFKQFGNVWYARLTKQIERQDGTAPSAIDLLTFVLGDPNFTFPIESTIGRALQEGRATVVRFLAYPEDESRYVTSIEVQEVKGKMTERHRYCAGPHEVVFETVDGWVD
jgi:hypothetical protein